MPATSTSVIVSTSVYLLSSAIFLGVVYSPLRGSVRAAELRMVTNVADGLQWQLDSLAPGLVISLTLTAPVFQPPPSISLEGHSITVALEDTVAVRQVHTMLPTMILRPGTNYVATIRGGQVIIEARRFG